MKHEQGLTDHFTRVMDSFFGQICSKVSVSIFHCDRMAARIDRWTEDLTLVWPEISVEGANLSEWRMEDEKYGLVSRDRDTLFEHAAE